MRENSPLLKSRRKYSGLTQHVQKILLHVNHARIDVDDPWADEKKIIQQQLATMCKEFSVSKDFYIVQHY